jgi:orotate phosphoribosyltransferase
MVERLQLLADGESTIQPDVGESESAFGHSAPAHRDKENQLSELQAHVVDCVLRYGLKHFDEPVRLASGELSYDFVDGKAALARGEHLEVACRALLEQVSSIDFTAVGGLTMGADQFAHVIAVLAGREWFVVRKEPKHRGTNKLIEGATLGSDHRVLLVDDVVTTGGSIQRAYQAITEAGASVAAAATLVDRGDVARAFFDDRSVPYLALVTYHDLGIAPVGHGLVPA